MTVSRSRLIFTLLVLLGINTMNFFDRQILPAVQEKIRKDWDLSDSKLGWLGTAFIVLYAVVGLPLGRLADTWRRKWILAVGVGLWSLLTLGSGFAWSFWSLFVMRLGVGVGEASCAPTASSLIGDLVPSERRARALSLFMIGLPGGLALSFFVSGAIADRWSWQAAFYVAGVPGLLLAVAALFIADPVRGGADSHTPLPAPSSRLSCPGATAKEEHIQEEPGFPRTPAPEAESLSEAVVRNDPAIAEGSPSRRTGDEFPEGEFREHPAISQVAMATPPFVAVVLRVLRMPTMWWIIASGALHNFNMYALGTFVASFLKRYHQVSVAEAGRMSGLIYGFGALGIFAAGWLGDRAFRHGPSGRLNIAWIGLTVAIPCLLLALAVPSGELWLCAVWLLPGCMLLYFYYGTVYATIQDIIEPSLRGMAMAIYFCAMYFLGAVLGPVATGWVSDYCAKRAAAAEGASVVTEWHKAIGLHDAMYLIPILNAVLVVVLFIASRTVKRDYLKFQTRMKRGTEEMGKAVEDSS
jgi:MFS family permease